MPSSIVNNLVRAAASIPTKISDTELDKHVAELLAREAKEKELKFRELGLGAYVQDPGNDFASTSLPKPNKRFLSSIIRTVDDHNASLLKSQADAARSARRNLLDAHSRSASPGSSRRDEPRRERPSGASRMFAGALGTAMGSRNRQEETAQAARRDRRGGRTGNDDERGSRDHRTSEGHGRRRSRSREREPEERHSSRRREEGREYRARRDRSGQREWAREEDVKGKERDLGRRSVSPRARRDNKERGEEGRRQRHRDREDQREETATRSQREDRDSPSQRKRAKRPSSASPPSEPQVSQPVAAAPPPASKMDKYFEDTYDPRFDYSAVLPVPKEGLVDIGSSVEVGWDGMLDVLKSRGKKKRAISPMQEDRDPYSAPDPAPMRSLHSRRSTSPIRSRRSKHSRHAHSDSDSDSSTARERRKRKKRKERERADKEAEAVRVAALGGYQYARKGQDREWDRNKETPT